MDEANRLLLPVWNLGLSAPSELVWLARMASAYLSTAALVWIAALLLIGTRPWRRMAMQVLLAIAIVWLLTRGIHAFWPQPRPFMVGLGHQWIEHTPSPGFPSHHATIGLAFGFMCALAAPRRWSGLLCLAIGLLIAWSRVALGVHFPMDVIAGGAIAATVALAVLQVWPIHRPVQIALNAT